MRLQRMWGAPLQGAELRAAPLRGGLCGTNSIEPLALGGNDELRLAQTRAQCIAFLQLVAETAREIRDARAHGRKFGFRLRGVVELGGRPGACAIQDRRDGGYA